ncbi:MAG: polyphosphate kinase 1 [Bacteroidetes bacterium]|nr:polyphosphate kinase 1 [Bacteroidota bacterium]
MPKSKNFPIINRDQSWLSFNERVLQEAEDLSVPLIERIRFLGIFSNNLDEFYRIRVAANNRLVEAKIKSLEHENQSPKEILTRINKTSIKLQNRFENVYKSLLNELENEQIFVVNEKTLPQEHVDFVNDYFDQIVRPTLVPIMLHSKTPFPKLKGKSIYFAVKLTVSDKIEEYAIMEIPSLVLPRFIILPNIEHKKYIILLDDVIRFKLDSVFAIFNFKKIEAYTVKVTLDAELDIDQDISQSIIDKISKSLKTRKSALPVRLVYDSEMPKDLLDFILAKNKSTKSDSIIPGGRYHNFKDFIDFPNVGRVGLKVEKLKPLKHPDLVNKTSILAEVDKKDILINYPYQTFTHLIDLLREAAIDPKVTSIKINLYRVAKNSKVVNALINAAKNGKNVTVVIELFARFDEQANIQWSNKMIDEGIKVIFGHPGLKVHSKLILITKKDKNKIIRYAHIGTGNFHEINAAIYADTSLLTKDKRLTNEVYKVFQLLKNNIEQPVFKHLTVSPFNARRKIYALLDTEIKNAKAGKPAYMIVKLNNLVDPLVIKKMYQASNAGVKIQLIIRGICSLVPGIKNYSENIEVISIIDSFLEHSRLMVFCNGGKELYFLTSADWMTRNIDRRIEVGCPIYDKKSQKIIKDMLTIQLADNTKARFINKSQNNTYKLPTAKVKVRSQIKLYNYFKQQLENS